MLFKILLFKERFSKGRGKTHDPLRERFVISTSVLAAKVSTKLIIANESSFQPCHACRTRCEEEISVFKSRLSLHYPLPSSRTTISFSCPKPPPFRSVSLFRIPVCERVLAAPPNSSGGRVNNLELPADGALEGLSFEPTTLLRCTTLSFSGHLTPVNDTRSSKKLRVSARLGH